MARHHRWVVLLDDKTWQIAQIEPDTFQTSDEQSYDRNRAGDLAEDVVKLLGEMGHRGEPILLAIGSSWCANATVGVPTRRRSRNRQAMAYLVEPRLPWAAEDFVLDYELSGTIAFTVAAESEQLAAFLGELELAGIPVDSVSPVARLALEHHLLQHPGIATRYALLWRHDEKVELWLIDHDRPTAWYWLPDEANAVSTALGRLSLSESDPLVVVPRNVLSESYDELPAALDLDWRPLSPSTSVDFCEAAFREASSVLEGRRSSSIELRRDALATRDPQRSVRPHLRLLKTAVVVLSVVVAAAMWLKTQQYDSLRQATQQQEIELFERLFPDRRVPVGIRSQLESELADLRGISGQASDTSRSVASMELLERLLRALPDESRFRLLEVRADNGRLYVLGQVRTHSDSDGIAEALREVGFDVSPPSTHRLQEQGVEFRLSARLGGPGEEQEESVR